MRCIVKYFFLWVAAISFLWAGKVFSQPPESADRTLSPYFFVKSEDPRIDPIPLKSTSAWVNLSGVIADVRVIQIYKNEGQNTLEAIYVFPASTRAAVCGMKMTIGERVIEAKMAKREDARREYEQARDQGKGASLLEQQRPNVFQMNVANILPGDEIKVELQYTELLVPTDRVYEFIYPTVVGPRYSNQRADKVSPKEKWVQNPYLHQGEAPSYTFDIRLNIAAGLPIRDLSCPSHKVAADFDGPSFARIRLDPSEASGGNRDFILRYRLAGDRIQSGLLLHEGEGENFFLLMMQPPHKVTETDIPGREYIFIVDVSGSMHGFPLDISKKLLKNLIGHLLPTDRFNLLLFSGGSSVMAEESLPATPENIQKAIHLIERQRGGGGTELLPALKRALRLEKPSGYARTVVIATDGYVNVEEEVFDLIRKSLGQANMFAFGIGTSVNRHIIEGMARVGMGEPFVITRPQEAPAQAERFRAMIQSPLLTQIKLKFHEFDAYDIEPLGIPDVLAERPVIVFGKWRGQPRGEIALSGIAGNGPYSEVIDVEKIRPLPSNSALRYLWARHRIALLSDYNKLRPNDRRIKEVTNLGLMYSLLTAYTSFVAVDTRVRNQNGKVTTIKQPLPLPRGVSDYAVGGMKLSRAYAPALAAKPALGESEDKALKGQGRQKDEDKRRVRLENTTVSEGVPREVILTFLLKKIQELENTWIGGELGGKLVLRCTLKKDGQVKSVDILASSMKNRRFQNYFIEQMKKWQFPAIQNREETKVIFSVVFGL